MSQYLVAIHLPDNFNPSAADEAAMDRDIDTLNEEMVAAGVRIFVGGLHPVREAKVAAGAARWQGARHRRAILGDQGARGRFLAAEMREPGRGTGVGAQGCRRLSGTGRGARVSPHSAGWPEPLILRASRISAPQTPLTRLEKWSSCRFSVSRTTI